MIRPMCFDPFPLTAAAATVLEDLHTCQIIRYGFEFNILTVCICESLEVTGAPR